MALYDYADGRVGELKCVLINGRSLRNKCFRFHAEVILQYDPSVVLITETWLSHEIDDCIFLCRRNYDIYRKDRIGRSGGGVVILCKKSLNCIQRNWETVGIESLWVEITQPKRITVGLFYNPHVDNVENMDNILATLEQRVKRIPNPVLVCGDFNQPGIEWNNLTAMSSHNQDLHLERFLATGLVQKVLFPTYISSQNTLDLVFETQTNLVTEVKQLDPLSFSDHYPVLFFVNAVPPASETIQRKDWRNMPKGLMKLYLELQNWHNVLGGNNADVNEAWENFKVFYDDFCNRFVPVRVIKPKSPKFPPHIHKLKNRYTNARTKYRRTFSLTHKTTMEERHSAYITALQTFVAEPEKRILEKNNIQAFYKFVRCRIGKGHPSPNIVTGDNEVPVTDDYEKSNLFNRYFSSVFTHDDDRQNAINNANNDGLLVVTTRLVKSAIKKLGATSSPGQDEIHPIVLKSFADVLAIPLTMIFNKSLSVGRLPEDWKKAVVVPIYKGKGNSSSCTNYRPISLTSHCCKIMERILKTWMLCHLTSHNQISNNQHGFLPGRSTVTNLISCLEDWTSALDDGDLVDVFYVDISKAFDTVPHNGLLQKMAACNLPVLITTWIKDFLSHRTQRVKIGNSLSDEALVTSGVPQGSVLGPILFLLYLNDIDSVVNNCKVQVYADDTKLYLRFPKEAEPTLLQDDINSVIGWLGNKKLKVAPDKCFILPLSLRGPRVPFDYKINNVSIPVVGAHIRDLGVLIDCNLTNRAHISAIKAKANARVGLIFKCFISRDVRFLTDLYKTYVRPLTEYASPAWNPHHLLAIRSIESVQRTFTRRIPNISHLNYPNRLKTVSLTSLEERRLCADLCEFYKIVNDQSIVAFEQYLTYQPIPRLRALNTLQLKPRFCRTTLAQNSFVNRNCKVWNLLPNCIVTSTSLAAFRNQLNSTDLSGFLKCFPHNYM